MDVSLDMEQEFEKAKGQLDFLYPNIALGEIGLFKIMVEQKLVEKVISPYLNK